MSSARKFCEAAHVALLGVCLGGLIITVAAAVIIFPTMRDLDPTLPAYAAWSGSHADLAAGKVQSKIFFVADSMQLICVGLAGLLLIGAVAADAKSMGRGLLAVRVLLLAILISSLGYYLFSLAPSMNADLVAYWEAAREGNVEQAAERRDAFDAAHPVARNFMAANALLIAALFTLGLFALARGVAHDHDSPAAADRYEEPRLASGAR